MAKNENTTTQAMLQAKKDYDNNAFERYDNMQKGEHALSRQDGAYSCYMTYLIRHCEP